MDEKAGVLKDARKKDLARKKSAHTRTRTRTHAHTHGQNYLQKNESLKGDIFYLPAVSERRFFPRTDRTFRTLNYFVGTRWSIVRGSQATIQMERTKIRQLRSVGDYRERKRTLSKIYKGKEREKKV